MRERSASHSRYESHSHRDNNNYNLLLARERYLLLNSISISLTVIILANLSFPVTVPGSYHVIYQAELRESTRSNMNCIIVKIWIRNLIKVVCFNTKTIRLGYSSTWFGENWWWNSLKRRKQFTVVSLTWAEPSRSIRVLYALARREMRTRKFLIPYPNFWALPSSLLLV